MIQINFDKKTFKLLNQEMIHINFELKNDSNLFLTQKIIQIILNQGMIQIILYPKNDSNVLKKLSKLILTQE